MRTGNCHGLDTLALLLLVANLANTKWCKNLRNDWNPGIWEYSSRAIQWIPTWHGLDGFQRFLHPCALDESSLSIGRVNPSTAQGYFSPKLNDANIFENHLNPVMLVFIRKLSLSTFKWVPIYQGFGHFSGFLHHFVLVKLVASSIRVKNDNWVPLISGELPNKITPYGLPHLWWHSCIYRKKK